MGRAIITKIYANKDAFQLPIEKKNGGWFDTDTWTRPLIVKTSKSKRAKITCNSDFMKKLGSWSWLTTFERTSAVKVNSSRKLPKGRFGFFKSAGYSLFSLMMCFIFTLVTF